MRILVVSDLHYRLQHYDWLVGAAAERRRGGGRGGPRRRGEPGAARGAGRRAATATSTGWPATAVVLAASGNHDLDGPGEHGEQVAGWLRQPRADGVHDRRRQRRPRRHALHGVPVVGRAAQPGGGRRAARRRGGRPARAMGVGLPRAAGRHGAVQGRATGVPRPRPGRLDRRAPAGPGALRAHPPGAVGRRRLVARPARQHLVFNPGRQIGPVPPHITIDTEAGTAEWFGVFDSETSQHPARLTAARQRRSVVCALGVAGRAGARAARPGGAPGCRGSGRPCRGARRRRRAAASRRRGTASCRRAGRPSSAGRRARRPAGRMRKASGSSTTRTSTSVAGAHGRGRRLARARPTSRRRRRRGCRCGRAARRRARRSRRRLQHEHAARVGALLDEHRTRGASTRSAGRRRTRAGRSPRHCERSGALRAYLWTDRPAPQTRQPRRLRVP